MVLIKMGKTTRIPLFFAVLCDIFCLGLCQWTYPSMGAVGLPQMPVQFAQPTVFPAMPFLMQPSCYTVCYPTAVPTQVILPNPPTCTPPTTTTTPVDTTSPSPTPTPPISPPVAPTPITQPSPSKDDTTIPPPPSKDDTTIPPPPSKDDTTTQLPMCTVPTTTEETPLIRGLRKKNFTVTFDLENYPLDFYYLMDYSGSMGDDKRNLIDLSPKLIDTIKNLSSDYQLGFGSFVDKPVSPFGGSGDYSFWHQITLSVDTSSFTPTVTETPILYGGDGPEGQFEGLYQTAVCTTEVGWRSNARKIILLTTDAQYHKAGDGEEKAGLTTPFDGKCHLDTLGKYSEEATMDYPSENQIKTVIEENQITVIFAVTAESTSYYTDLSQNIKSSKVATLSSDSANIIDLVNEAYNEISSTVEIEASGATNDATINYFSRCTGIEEKKTVCPLPSGGSVSYTVEVEMDCPVDPSKTLSVNPVGVPSNVNIDISSICM